MEQMGRRIEFSSLRCFSVKFENLENRNLNFHESYLTAGP